MFVPFKPFQPSLMFVGKARRLPWSGAPERFLNWVASGLTRNHYTTLEQHARDEHSSLSLKFVNYGLKQFYNKVAWLGMACPVLSLARNSNFDYNEQKWWRLLKAHQNIIFLTIALFFYRLKVRLHVRFSSAFLMCILCPCKCITRLMLKSGL